MRELSMARFEYEPLRDDSMAFRFLLLLPGAGDTQLECTLVEGSRENRMSAYEALSYVWGDPTASQKIILNKNEFFITSNLHIALRNLRRVEEERILWVDAICINQDCLDEKTQQVSQMRDIHK
jgi:hypothetical protein